MVDPYTGLVIPKLLPDNLAWRKRLLREAKGSSRRRALIHSACATSPIYWLNAFGFTFLQKQVNEEGKEVSVQGADSHVPFITWRIQDDALRSLHDAITHGQDCLISKSRDMGASWIVLALFHWHWQFKPSTTFLELSRKQALVDRRGDMDSLFEKHRYLLRMQPDWLRPRKIQDNLGHLENKDIGSTIEGESTNKDAGQASRKTAILLDEFARIDEGEEIDLATADTSACRIFNSTPGGPATHFTHVWRAMKANQREGKIITLPWWDHPLKGRDARPVEEADGWVLTSPWREREKMRRSKRNLAQNVDMLHGQAGDAFFSFEEIEKHRKLYERPPTEGNVLYDEDYSVEVLSRIVRKQQHEEMLWSEIGTWKPWHLWVPLIDERPNQLTRYVFGVDISGGTGQSNSVISVLDHQTDTIVAKWWDSHTGPEQFATIVALSATWFGGQRPPLVIFEKNGPGGIFGRKLLSLGYPSIWYMRVDSTKRATRTPRWGWHSSPARKEMLLGEYRDALSSGTIINPCKQALDEALDYAYDDKGRIDPGTSSDGEGGGQALHGDHVVADALTLLGRKDLPRDIQAVKPRTPGRTFAARKKQWEKRKNRERAAWSD
jgi:hypothetical protein